MLISLPKSIRTYDNGIGPQLSTDFGDRFVINCFQLFIEVGPHVHIPTLLKYFLRIFVSTSYEELFTYDIVQLAI